LRLAPGGDLAARVEACANGTVKLPDLVDLLSEQKK